MKIYKTFEECKLAHPDCEVYRSLYDNRFSPKAYSDYYAKCEPSDHLMSLHEFLSKGFKLVGGDVYVVWRGKVIEVNDTQCDAANTPSIGDKERYILKAKALESDEKSPMGQHKNTTIDVIKENATKLMGEDNTSLEVRQACKNLIETINKSELLPKSYELYCEFYGEESVDFVDFEMREWDNKVWLHFAKKLQEVENEYQS